MQEPNRKTSTLVLLAITAAVFAPSLFGGFVSDDRRLIEGDPRVADSARLGELLSTPLWDIDYDDPSTDAPYARIHRPLMKLAFVLGNRLAGGHPVGHHLVALALHLAVVWLVVRFLARRGARPLAAFAGALVFAVHPTRVESVAWASGISDTLLALFALLGAELAARAFGPASADEAGSPRPGRLPAPLAQFGLVALGFAAAASKEPALLVAPYLVAIECRAGTVSRAVRASAVACSALGAAAALGLAAYVSRHVVVPRAAFDLARPVAALGAALLRVVAPLPITLDPFPLRFDANGERLLPPALLAIGALGLALGPLGAVVLARSERARAWRTVLPAAGLFAIAILPVLGFEGRRAPALLYDRFLYLPMLGVAWGWAATADAFPPRVRAALLTLSAALMVGLAPLTVAAVVRFGDEAAQNAYEIRLHPSDPRLCASNVRFALASGSLRDPDGALLRCAALARAAHRDRFELTLLLGIVVDWIRRTPDREDPGARSIRDGLVRLHDRGVLDVNVGGHLLRAQVGPVLLAEVRRHPELLHVPIAVLSNRIRDFTLASRWAERAIRITPRMPDAWMAWLTALVRARRFDEARTVLGRARATLSDAPGLFDGFAAAENRAEAIAAQRAPGDPDREARIAEAIADPAGVLLAYGAVCRSPPSAEVTMRCTRAALQLGDRAGAVATLEARARLSPEERPDIERALASLRRGP